VSFIFDIQKISFEHKKTTLKLYILSFAPKDSNQWIILGVYNSFKEADDTINLLSNLDSESLRKIFDYRCERVFWRFEKEIEETSNEKCMNYEGA